MWGFNALIPHVIRFNPGMNPESITVVELQCLFVRSLYMQAHVV